MRLRNYLWLLLPISAFLAFVFIVPVFNVFSSTVWVNEQLSFQHYLSFLTDGFYLQVLGRTLGMAVLVTGVCIVLAYPVSFLIFCAPAKKRSLLLALVVFPLLTNPVVRSFSWMIMLGRHGLISSLLQLIGIFDEPTRLLYTPGAVVVGLIHLFLPLMVLSLVSAMENIHPSVLEASSSLGANELTTFRTVILPLTYPGLMTGMISVFTGAVTAYVTPQMLGGSRVLMLSTLLRQQAMVLFNWDAAAVIAVITTGLTLVFIMCVNMLQRRRVKA